MEMNEQGRRKRVSRLKKTIIFLLIFFLLLPLIICLILGIQIKELRSQVDELSRLVAARESTTELRTVEVKETDSPEAESPDEDTEELEEEASQSAMHKVYLTFDDGPSIYTNEILDILKEYDVKATFFVVGKEDEDSLQAYKRIVDEGHTIAIHSYSHLYSEIYQSVDSYEADLERLVSLIYENTGVQCKYVRFPGGSSNKVSKVSMSDIIHLIHDQDMEYFDWNVSASDAVNASLSSETIISNVMGGIDKYDTAVVLMHDTGSRKSTVEALPTIIQRIKELDGYEILPISDDTELIQHLKIED